MTTARPCHIKGMDGTDAHMRLILTSTGFSTPEIVGRCVELAGKPRDAIKIAAISEAHIEIHGDHKWLLDDLNRARENFNHVELVNLQALGLDRVEERVRSADVIFVTGGDTDYLMSVFEKTDFGKLLPSLLEDRVYVGSSAGSMVMGKRADAEAYLRTYGESSDDRYGISKWLELVDLAVHPHFEASRDAADCPEALLEASREYQGVIYAIKDDAAIVVNGGKLGVIGSEPVVVKDGRLVKDGGNGN